MATKLPSTGRLATGPAAPLRRRVGLAVVAVAIAIALLASSSPIATAHNNAHPSKPAFGTSVWGVHEMKAKGVTPAYALVWAEEHDLEKSMYTVRKELRMARDAGVTPVVQWYYWGDDITVSCIKYGCNGKSTKEWYSYAYKLAWHIRDVMGSRLAIVVLETEFNKNGVQWYEGMDYHLMKHSWIFRNKGFQTAVGFGNWAPWHWERFDRAVGASHYVGLQNIASAYRQSDSEMLRSAEDVYSSGKSLHDKFGKRVLVTDFAVSTWKGKEWIQEREVKDIVWQKEKYARAGIVGVVYRWVKDVPQMGWGHHGYAEKYWGLKYSDGRWKPAFNDWLWGTKGTPSAWGAYNG